MPIIETFIAICVICKFEENNCKFFCLTHCCFVGVIRSRGKNRRISVFKYKVKEKSETKSVPTLTFSEEARGILQDLFLNYPPDDEDGIKESAGRNSTTGWQHRGPDEIFYKPRMRKVEIARAVESHASRVESVTRLRQVVTSQQNS